MCVVCEDEDEMLESGEKERWVAIRDRLELRMIQGQYSFGDESDEDDTQLKGRGPLTRCVLLCASKCETSISCDSADMG